MNKTFGCVLAALWLAACAPANKDLMFEIANPSDADQSDAQFVLTRADLRPVTDATLPVVTDDAGQQVPTQVDDMDGDGVWDELAFVYSLAAGEKKQVKVSWVDAASYPEFKARTNVHLGKKLPGQPVQDMKTDVIYGAALPWNPYPYQTDGPAWENDLAGFRHYFDGRHSRDFFGKKTTEMVMDKVGIRPDGTIGDTYHVMADWGRDILSCANSFGLGGLALYRPDTLIRFGVLQYEPKGVMDSTRFTLINKGPVRGVFTLEHYGWDVGGGAKIDVKQTVVIWAGRYGYENRLEAKGIPAGSQLVTGLVTSRNDMPLHKDVFGNLDVMLTHDLQSYEKDFWFGMCVMIPSVYFDRDFEAPEVGRPGKDPGLIQTWCARLNMPEGKACYYVFGAWGEGDRRFEDRQFFVNTMKKEGQLLSNRATIREVTE
ncbi:MAG: DUF4861 domain-containing protein [Bacteroidales bacterium]|nr:DUF4861 domain-containing protein [Bacteroidales bacterium]